MTELPVLLTGIGGQGIQLAARVLAEAAVIEGREVQLFASYGGMMRGGRTDATVVVADGPIDAPPVVARAFAVIGLHPDHLADPLSRLGNPGVALLNAALIDEGEWPTPDDVIRVDLPLTTIAQEVGNPMAGALVGVGAFAVATRLVGLDSLRAAVEVALPPYRQQHIASSIAALEAGAATEPRLPWVWPENQPEVIA